MHEIRSSAITLPILAALAILSGACHGGGDGLPPDAVFPDDFLWGTASAAYQVEGHHAPGGGVIQSNWSEWECMDKIANGDRNVYGSGFYEQYEEDLDLAQGLNNNAYRLGLAWERIEPAEGVFDMDALQHYLDVIDAIRARGITPMVTFYHWVAPAWLDSPLEGRAAWGDRGGCVVDAFERFVRFVLPHLAERVDLYSVINEPYVVASSGYLIADHPPGRLGSLSGMTGSLVNFLFAHAAAFRAIKAIDTLDADGDGLASMVGCAHASTLFLPLDPSSPADVRAAESWSYIANDLYLNALVYGDLDVDLDGRCTNPFTHPPEGHYEELAGTLEFIGVNYYGPSWVQGEGFSWIPLAHGVPAFDTSRVSGAPPPMSEMPTAIVPGALRAVIERFSSYGLPLYITENGCCDADDDQRPRYLVEHLYLLGRMIAAGHDIRGYFHWSLTDNFEWSHGYEKRFGLYRIDYDSPAFTRTETGSAALYREIAGSGRVTADLLQEYTATPY